MCAVNEAERVRKIKRKGGPLPVCTYAAPAHAVSAVHGALLANRESIRLVAKGVLQSALRTVIESKEGQEESKKCCQSGKIKYF